MSLTVAIQSRLAGDALLAADLSTYRGVPAVFTQDPVPEDAELPYVVTCGEVGQSAFDTKTSRGRDAVRDVRCYANATGSVVLIERIAERVRELLHRHQLAGAIYTTASGPTVLPTDSTVYGRLVSLRWVGTLS